MQQADSSMVHLKGLWSVFLKHSSHKNVQEQEIILISTDGSNETTSMNMKSFFSVRLEL